MVERSKDWKAGYATGCRHTKDAIWGAVYDYVHRHNPARADEMKCDVVAALTEKSNRELNVELSDEPIDELRSLLALNK